MIFYYNSTLIISEHDKRRDYIHIHRLFSFILHTYNFILDLVLWFCYQKDWKRFWVTLYFLCLHLLWRLWQFAHSYFSDLWTRELWCNRQIRQNQEFRNVLYQFGPDDFNGRSVPFLKKHYNCDLISKKYIFYVNDKNTLGHAFILLRR